MSALTLWAFGDAHVGTDQRHGVESLARALRDSESGAFAWDVAVDIGDMSGGQHVPDDDEGAEIVRQFGALRNHPREAIYSVCGNHDRGRPREVPANAWWRTWIDPEGAHPDTSGVSAARRPYPLEGTWERYSFRVGNLLFLMMSDINEPTQKLGRGDLDGFMGGNPGGVVSGDTFRWWREQVEANRDAIIITAHHYMLKDTTVASGAWEGMRKNAAGAWENGYHGYKPQGTPEGASYLYWVDSVPDAQAFETYLAQHPGAIALWLGGHTHAHPDAMDGGKSHIETRWGTTFVNVGSLTRHHICPHVPNPPKSRVFSFTPGSKTVRVQCFMHTAEFLPRGWYAAAEREITLPRPFEW